MLLGCALQTDLSVAKQQTKQTGKMFNYSNILNHQTTTHNSENNIKH